MDKVMVTIGPVSIYWYSFLMVVAVLIGSSIATSYSRKINMPSTIISDMLFGVVVSGIIGARIYYVIFNFDTYRNNLLDIFKIWEGGLAIYGAIIAGIIYIFYYCHKKEISFIKMLDVCSLPLLLGQAIGRWGNFFNQEAYGTIITRSSLENMYLPDFIIDGMYIDGAYRVPTFLYESVWCLLGVLILLYIRKKRAYIEGRQLSFYLIWYGIGRFIIESMRTDSLYIGDFRVSMIVSALLIIIGILLIIRNYKKKHKNDKLAQIGGQDGRI